MLFAAGNATLDKRAMRSPLAEARKRPGADIDERSGELTKPSQGEGPRNERSIEALPRTGSHVCFCNLRLVPAALLACRLIQIALTVGFCGFALYGLGMTLLGKMHSPLGGLAASAGAAGLAFVSFRVFEWIIRSRFGD